MLAPSELGSLELSHSVSRFSRPEFKIKLLGSWNETEGDGEYEYLEITGERQIVVTVVNLPEELDPDERQDAIGRKVRELNASIRQEATTECHFGDVRFFEADGTMQARWVATSPEMFVAACIYAAPMRFVSLAYRDFRPNLNDETRGRQAGESVASFRVK